jgi:hypothetical protein
MSSTAPEPLPPETEIPGAGPVPKPLKDYRLAQIVLLEWAAANPQSPYAGSRTIDHAGRPAHGEAKVPHSGASSHGGLNPADKKSDDLMKHGGK